MLPMSADELTPTPPRPPPPLDDDERAMPSAA